MLGTELATVSTTEGAAYGTAVLAAVASGWFGSVDAATSQLVTVTTATVPGADAERYAEGHARYRALYPALSPHFHGS